MIMGKGYSYFEHPSDIGIRCRSKSLEELLINAASAIYELMIDTKLLKETESRDIDITAVDLEDLFSQWISELIFFSHGHHLFFIRFDFKSIEEKHLTAAAFGQKSTDTVRMYSEVKGITYHNYFVRKSRGIWEAQFIVDV